MKYRLIIAAVSAVLLIDSCANEIGGSGASFYGVGFNVSVEDLRTRGEFINTTGSTQPLGDFASSISEFYVSAYDADGGVFIPADTKISYDGTSSSWNSENRYLWSDGLTATFLAYANLPSEGTSVTSTAESQTLQYGTPLSAVDQTDILLGFCRQSASSSATAIADITFRHPLAAVVFKKGVMDGIKDINSIIVSGIAGSGTLEVLPEDPDNYVWEVSGYSSSSDQSSREGLPIDADAKLGEPFFLIPQNLEDHPLKVDVAATMSSGELKTMTLQIASGELQAGVTTVFTLTLDAKSFGISVESSVSENSLSNVRAALLGNKEAFIRAAITGNWVDSAGDITEGWAVENASSSFVGLAGSGWTKNTGDGFWYYTEKVSSSTDIASLFTNFTRPAARADGSQFELDIFVQAVEATSGKTWQTAFSN